MQCYVLGVAADEGFDIGGWVHDEYSLVGVDDWMTIVGVVGCSRRGSVEIFILEDQCLDDFATRLARGGQVDGCDVADEGAIGKKYLMGLIWFLNNIRWYVAPFKG